MARSLKKGPYVDEKILEEMPRPYEKICASFPKWARRIGE